MREFRYALRLVRRSPGLSLVAVLSLALGIGANATIFSFANALLFRKPPVSQPERLVEVYTHDPSPGAALGGMYPLSYPDWKDMSARAQTLSGLAIYNPAAEVNARLGGAAGMAWTGQLVSPNYFSVLGLQPVLGRAFLPGEADAAGQGSVVVLSYATWQQQFGADRGAVGRTITMDGVPFTVIGIAPRGFAGVMAGVECQFWVPITMAERLGLAGTLTSRGSRSLFAFARLKPGVTVAAANSEVDALQRGIALQYPKIERSDWGGLAVPIGMVPTPFRSFVGTGTLLLAVVVGLVLLIACANAALVLLVAALGRRREWALRSALGASRGRLVRQALVHSTLLALIAGGLGLLLAQWLGPLLLELRPPGFPIELPLGLDSHVLLFTLVIALATGILFGLVPAWQGARVRVLHLREGSAGAGASRSYARSGFIIAQVALCVVVLVGAALCLRSLEHANAIDPGFDAAHIISAGLDPQSLGYTGDAARQFLDRARAAVAALPGVEAASFTTTPPLQLSVNGATVLPDGVAPPAQRLGYDVDQTTVGPDYFAAAGTRLLAGRDFTAADLAPGHPREVVVNETLAQKFWPRGDALGRMLRFPGDTDTRPAIIVAIAQNGKYRSLGEAPRPYLYQLKAIDSPASLVVRVAGDPRAFRGAIEHTLGALDPNLTGDAISTGAETMQVPRFPARFAGILLGGFGLLALLLAVVGLYGVIAAAVAQRTREYGIRLALGAGRGVLLKLVVGQGLRLALWGVLAGAVAATLATQLMSALLYGLSPLDPLSYVAAIALLLAVAALASLVPAFRATRTDPLISLHSE